MQSGQPSKPRFSSLIQRIAILAKRRKRELLLSGAFLIPILLFVFVLPIHMKSGYIRGTVIDVTPGCDRNVCLKVAAFRCEYKDRFHILTGDLVAYKNIKTTPSAESAPPCRDVYDTVRLHL